jgi:trans-aconitate methyltransferase
LFYGPLHFLLIRHIVATLPLASAPSDVVVDLGCGTGAAGAAWASGSGTRTVFGVDRNPWATAEAIRTYREFGLDGRVRRDDIATVRLPKARSVVVAAFTMNELSDEARDDVMGRLVERVERGDRILVVEPLAGFVAPWWNRWRDAFASMGGRADEWRVKTELPPIVAKLDRAAGLDHREITGRSLWSG